MQDFQIGDWAQAAGELTEFLDTRTESLVANEGNVAHVRAVFPETQSAMVWFEHTDVTSEVDFQDLIWVCRSDAGNEKDGPAPLWTEDETEE